MRRRTSTEVRRNFIPIYDWSEVPVMFDLPLLSRLIGKNVETLRRATIAGEIPAVKGMGEWRFHKDKIREWLEAG
jgi:excisionase family DNA binding protein